MKELEENIRKNGYDYKRINSTEKGYIYQQLLNKKHLAYEVFKRVENERFNCVSFPSNESFGKWAWTFFKFEDAVEKLSTF